MDISFLPIKALALDLDGTLLRPDNSLSGRAANALRNCAERGVKLIICTGRSPEASEKYRESMRADGPMVYFNGAEITDMPPVFGKLAEIERKPFYPALLSREIIDFCVDASRETGAYFQVYFPESVKNKNIRLIAEKSGAESAMYFKHTGSQAVIADIKEHTAPVDFAGCIKGMFLAEPEKLEAIREILQKRLGGSVYLTRTLRTFLEVLPPAVSKGTGLKTALERLSIAPENVIAFGDEESDLPMFEAAGYSAAPANAKESVKNAARWIIPSNAEDGVARFLDSFSLI
jgi:Cof subfamily protein (haloacid dehalogenase superfamily)